MKVYKVTVEATFVRLPGESDLFGFFSTYYVESGSAVNAARQVGSLVRIKIASLGVEQTVKGLLAATVCIKDIWELNEKPALQIDQDGASFYRMSPLAITHAIIRRTWMRAFNRHLIIEYQGIKGDGG